MKNIMTLLIIGLLSPIISSAADAVHIRALAASCAACHGTEGSAVMPQSSKSGDSGRIAALAGMDKAEIQTKLLKFKSGERQATVMHRHAKGLTEDEITALADYFSAQPLRHPAPLVSQKLQADHAN